MLIATRGFGNDLSSAKVPSIQVDASDVLREHYYLGGDEKIRRSAYFCSYQDAGAQTINLVGVSVATTQVVEYCEGDEDSFENAFWFNEAGGIVKSAQWVGPLTGTLIIEFVPRTGPVAPQVGPSVTIAAAPVEGGPVVISGSLD